MKHLFLVIATMGLFIVNSQAQDARDIQTRFMVGAKAGVNLSNVYDTQAGDMEADAKGGFVGGGFLSIPIGRFFGVQPEVLYSQKGYKATGNSGSYKYAYSRTNEFIDVPVLFVFKPVKVLSIVAGPQFSYLIRQTDSFNGPNLTVEQEQEFDHSNVRKNILCFLGGVDFNVNHFVFGARAGWDIQNNNGDGTYSDPRYKNVWYQATVGYRFY